YRELFIPFPNPHAHTGTPPGRPAGSAASNRERATSNEQRATNACSRPLLIVVFAAPRPGAPQSPLASARSATALRALLPAAFDVPGPVSGRLQARSAARTRPAQTGNDLL